MCVLVVVIQLWRACVMRAALWAACPGACACFGGAEEHARRVVRAWSVSLRVLGAACGWGRGCVWWIEW